MIEKVNIPVGKKGEWVIDKFTPDHFSFHFALQGRAVPKGETFTRLCRGNQLVMSDTPAEQKDHAVFYRIATGHVLIAGLGIGMILEAVAKKQEVTKVTVVEISQDLIDLVWPTYKERYGGKIEIVCADINEWTPINNFNAAWFDIWDDISDENLPQMVALHRKYAKCAKWRGSWGERLARKLKRDLKEAERLGKILAKFAENPLMGNLHGMKV